MHGLAVYVKEGLPVQQELFLENSADSYLCFWQSSSSLRILFDSVSSNIDEVSQSTHLLINPTHMFLTLETS